MKKMRNGTNNRGLLRARGFKTFFHAENKKKKSAFLGSDKSRMLFFPLINVKMPTIVGILTFMRRKNFILS